MSLAVNQLSPEVLAMGQEWPIVDALLAGTRGMRAAGERLLPKWPNEEAEAYKARLATATLFPAFRRTLGVMAGKPFSKEITLSDDVAPRVREWCDDVDMQGRNLHSFAADALREAIGHGIAGVLVDHPPNPGVRTLADERAIGARPYFVHIRHEQILGWQANRVNGVIRLTQLRLLETVDEPDGPYGSKPVAQVRVLEPGKWETHRAGADGKFVLHEQGTTTLTEIPFAPFYGQRAGFMIGESPLLDLAYLNIEHWQSKSDQQTVLHVARVPILAIIGAQDDTALTVGASSAVKLPQGADMKFVEHSGAAIEAGRQSLRDLEEQMIQTGAELLVAKPGQRSATEANNDAEANKSELQAIVENFEDSLDLALYFMGAWVGEKQTGNVSLFKDFGAATLSEASAQLIVSMQQGGLLTKATALREQQRRGVIAADIDPNDELAAVAEEGPALGLIGREDDG